MAFWAMVGEEGGGDRQKYEEAGCDELALARIDLLPEIFTSWFAEARRLAKTHQPDDQSKQVEQLIAAAVEPRL